MYRDFKEEIRERVEEKMGRNDIPKEDVSKDFVSRVLSNVLKEMNLMFIPRYEIVTGQEMEEEYNMRVGEEVDNVLSFDTDEEDLERVGSINVVINNSDLQLLNNDVGVEALISRGIKPEQIRKSFTRVV